MPKNFPGMLNLIYIMIEKLIEDNYFKMVIQVLLVLHFFFLFFFFSFSYLCVRIGHQKAFSEPRIT